MRNLFLVLSLGVIATIAVAAQKSANNVARFTFIVPKDGMQKQFEDGYKRHLQWHINNGDKWNWYGWFIASGDRLGYFVDATFGHNWPDFDKPVDPAGDITDVSANVLPYAKFYTIFTCEFLPAVSKGSESDLKAALPQTIYFKIKPGFESDFEIFLIELHKDWAKLIPAQNYLWYRIEDGAKSPQYLLFLPHGNFAEKQRSQNFLARLWMRNAGGPAAFQKSVDEVVTETLRYRPDMTFIPK